MGISFKGDYRFKETIPATWVTRFDAADGLIMKFNPVRALDAMHSVTPVTNKIDRMPARGEVFDVLWAPHLFAKTFDVQPKDDKGELWETVVNYGVADDGNEQNTQEINPLFRQPVFDLEYIEETYEIKEAENVEALPHAGKNGANRPEGTLGPIVNAAGTPPDTPLGDVERTAVLTVSRNFPDLTFIATLNTIFQRTTNNGVVYPQGSAQGFAKETLQYMVTDSQGRRKDGTFPPYYPGVTRIKIRKTTQYLINNYGYRYWDSEKGEIVEDETKDVRDPVNLNMSGEKDETPTVVKYRHLKLLDYDILVT